MIDATCQLVTNVHNWAERFARQGRTVIVVGHRNHVEPLGILSHVPPERARLVESLEDAWRVTVADQTKVACITQTTLVTSETRAVRAVLRLRFPEMKEPPAATICYATDNRQTAVEALARRAEVVYVVGSEFSSNSNSLRVAAERAGARAYLIDDPVAIRPADLAKVKTVGLTAGASAPESQLRTVIDRLKALGADKIEEVEVIREQVASFTLPARLRELAREQGCDLNLLRKKALAEWEISNKPL